MRQLILHFTRWGGWNVEQVPVLALVAVLVSTFAGKKELGVGRATAHSGPLEGMAALQALKAT